MNAAKSTFTAAIGLALLTAVGCSDMGNRASNRDQTGAADRDTAADRAPTGALSAVDRDFAMKAAQGGMAEVELGKLAQDRGTSDKVKELGKRLVEDHTRLNNELKEIAAKEGITLPTEMDEKHRDTINRLSKLSGAQFDREFLKEVTKEHRDDIELFRREAERGENQALKSFAASNVSLLEDHLKMAESAESGPTSSNNQRNKTK
jgi:putative membrane protein